MRMELGDIVVRDFKRGDVQALWRMVREKEILRFMGDWAENAPTPQELCVWIDWLATREDFADLGDNKRYAVACQESDELIGMVGVGLEQTLCEVEVAYFMSERHQRKGYATRAVRALVDRCFQESDVAYLILTIDCANTPSCRLAEKCGFELFEKRTPIGHAQPNMVSDSYYYYRLPRPQAPQKV